MTTKMCKKCGAEKELTEFYKHPKMADGHLNICKECIKVYATTYRKTNIEKIKEYDRHRPNQKERYLKQKEQRENDVFKKETYLKSKKEWDARNRHKKNAHTVVRRAIKSGKITKPDRCQICGKVGEVQAHHEDYNKPLEVIFVCSNCHGMIHRYKNAFIRAIAS